MVIELEEKRKRRKFNALVLSRAYFCASSRAPSTFSKNKKRFPLLYLLFILLVLQLREGGRERGDEAASLVFLIRFFWDARAERESGRQKGKEGKRGEKPRFSSLFFFYRNASDGLTPNNSRHASYVQNPIATPGATL